MKHLLALGALALSLPACSPKPAETPANDAAANAVDANAAAPATAPSPAAAAAAAANVLTPEGLAELRIGEPLPAGTAWKKDEQQASDSCITYSAAAFPGVYAIVEDGAVRRISVVEGTAVKLATGIGIGATEAAVRAAYPGLIERPHDYTPAPAKNLTTPGTKGRNPGLRFEIGEDGKLSIIHAGAEPVLGYSEGCA
ncbi:hypothetical protein ACFQ1E_03830 [Sphingomonas canadensis]|uniref:Uncharacterized protein n=1 Tax=Sphingomonas canadensis TaxID=1219257 RepID=A0ABW3H207_9SPHN|nr:hypothetical protein [Sphingomonas canadensis]MCW3834627.1 hypothetical protein [Sphingomonas canadensis]